MSIDGIHVMHDSQGADKKPDWKNKKPHPSMSKASRNKKMMSKIKKGKLTRNYS